MITVAKLKELLNDYSDTHEVRWFDGSQITHINAVNDLLVLSDRKYIGQCCKCGNQVYPDINNKDYAGYCISCDENLYKMEIE